MSELCPVAKGFCPEYCKHFLVQFSARTRPRTIAFVSYALYEFAPELHESCPYALYKFGIELCKSCFTHYMNLHRNYIDLVSCTIQTSPGDEYVTSLSRTSVMCVIIRYEPLNECSAFVIYRVLPRCPYDSLSCVYAVFSAFRTVLFNETHRTRDYNSVVRIESNIRVS